MSLCVRSLGLKLEHASESAIGLVEPQTIANPIPGVSVQWVQGGAGGFACLTSFGQC